MFAGPLGRSTFTPPKSSFDSPLYGLVSLRRSQIDPLDERHDEKVDALADDLALTKELVRRMAAALGVLRRDE